MKSNNEEIKGIPAIGLGTWMLKGKECEQVVSKAIQCGYRHVDTAEMYDNEEYVGLGLANTGVSRSQLFITSKVWRDNLGKEEVIRSCRLSLERLGTSYLDLYLVHWPNKEISLEETFSAMKQLLDEGKIKAMGVSNFTIEHLKEAILVAEKLGISIAVNQVEFHPLLYQKELLDFCNEHDIQLVAYSPLARGEVLSHPILKEISQEHTKTSAQVVLRWLLQKDIVVIPKSSSEDHLRKNLDVHDFSLSKEEVERIDSMDKNKRLVNPPFNEF